MLKKDARIRAFHTVALLGGFTKAAKSLSLSQQAVSFQIKSLEDELGTRLLQRQGKNVALTDTGEILYRYAKQILDLYTAAEDALAKKTGAIGGSVNIGATGSIAKHCLPKAIGIFRKAHQSVGVTVSVANSERVAELLAQEAIDLGVISGGPVELGRFIVEPFFEDELVFVSASTHPLAARKSISLPDLLACEFVIREKGSGTRTLMEEYFSDRGVDPATLLVSAMMGSTEAIKAVVASSDGISMISKLSLGESKDCDLAILDTQLDPLFRSFHIVRLRDSYLRRALDSFVRALRSSNSFRA